MAKQIKKRLGLQRRPVIIDRSKVNKDARTVDLSFSSEIPVERWWGTEILSHEAGACDLSRLLNSAPLLLDHDPRQQIGVIERAEVDGDKKGRATVRFGNSPKAQEIFQDVQDGIRGKVSVGYSINRMQMEEMDGDPEDSDDAEATYRATSWTPYEISLVSIPADDTVGVGRVEDSTAPETIVELSPTLSEKNMKLNHPLFDHKPTDGNGPAILEARNNEKNRAKEIMAIANRFRTRVKDVIADANAAIDTDLSIDAFRAKVMDGLETKPLVVGPEEYQGRSLHEVGSMGDRLTNSPVFKELISNRGKGRGSANFSVELPANEAELRMFLSRGANMMRAAATPLQTTGLTSIQKQPEVVQLNLLPMRVADLLMPGETAAVTVRYIAENSFANLADAVAENAAIPEQQWDLTEIDAGVHKIGVLGRVTQESMDDFPALRSYVDQRLAYAVGIKEDSELLNGSGAGAHIKGLLNFANVQNVAFGGPGDTVPDACFKALVKIRTVGWAQPTAFVMNPTDWQNIRLTKDKNGQYLFGGPSTGPYGYGPYTVSGFMWGLPVVETTSIAQGTIFTGAFNQDAQIFRRIGLMIETTNSDASDFANNRIAIRAVERLALACYRALSFCTITGIPLGGV